MATSGGHLTSIGLPAARDERDQREGRHEQDERDEHDDRGRSFARVVTGRIVEVRALRLVDLADIERLNAEVLDALRRAGPGALVFADHRFASPIGRDIADAWARGMRCANRDVARSAILLDPGNATFNLQLERIVRCAGHDSRRVFSCVDELFAWMDPPSERERDAAARVFAEAVAGEERAGGEAGGRRPPR